MSMHLVPSLSNERFHLGIEMGLLKAHVRVSSYSTVLPCPFFPLSASERGSPVSLMSTTIDEVYGLVL